MSRECHDHVPNPYPAINESFSSVMDICDYCLAVFSLTTTDLQTLQTLLNSSNTSGQTDIDTSGRETTHQEDQPEQKRAKLSRPSPSDPPSQCMLCLSLNSEGYIEELTERVLKELDVQQYRGLSSFVLAIHAPLSLKVRRMGMEHLVRDYRSTVNVDEQICPTSKGAPSQPPSSQASCKRDPIDQTSVLKQLSDEYYVKTNVRLRVKHLIEKKRPDLSYDVDSPFLITVKLSHATSDRDCQPVIDLTAKDVPKRKVNRSRYKPKQPSCVTTNAVNDSIQALTSDDYPARAYFLSAVHEPCSYEIEFTHKPVLIGGRYNKFSRTLPQTPWIIDGERKAESSVEELICGSIVSLFKADGHNFSSSGREDVDVQMLGTGRPFVVELLNPRNILFNDEDLKNVEEDINAEGKDRIKVRRLKAVSKEATNSLRKGEEEKVKCYSSCIWTPEEITAERIKFLDDITNLEVHQKTPIRVLHRRTLATRKRIIYDMKTEYIDKHHFSLQMSTQAGTYVKEFVHGDFGRTQPNLRVLMKQDVDILSLDVLQVKVEWPI